MATNSFPERFAEVARTHHRNAEAHGRFLIEPAILREPLDTCGQLRDAHATLPPPDVALEPLVSRDLAFDRAPRVRRVHYPRSSSMAAGTSLFPSFCRTKPAQK